MAVPGEGVRASATFTKLLVRPTNVIIDRTADAACCIVRLSQTRSWLLELMVIRGGI